MPATVSEGVHFGAYAHYSVEFTLLDVDSPTRAAQMLDYSLTAQSMFVASGLFKKLQAFLRLKVICCFLLCFPLAILSGSVVM